VGGDAGKGKKGAPRGGGTKRFGSGDANKGGHGWGRGADAAKEEKTPLLRKYAEKGRGENEPQGKKNRQNIVLTPRQTVRITSDKKGGSRRGGGGTREEGYSGA